MKLTRALVSYCLLVALPLHAQSKQELSLFYGVLALPELSPVFNNAFAGSLLVPVSENGSISATSFGQIGVGFRNYIVPKLPIGGVLSYSQATVTVSEPAAASSTYTVHYINLLGRADYRYVIEPYYQFYSGLAAGVALNTYSTPFALDEGATGNRLIFAFQLTVVGFRFGKKLGGFAELGFGHLGLVNAGMSFRF